MEDALRMATYNGYWASFDEKERGSLETGKIADMVILSENPYTIPNERIKELKVERLILKGKDYEPQSQSVAATVAKGLIRRHRIRA